MQGVRQHVPVLEQGTLVDLTFVSDLALVYRRRLGHQVQPGDAVGTARGHVGEVVQELLEVCLNGVALIEFAQVQPGAKMFIVAVDHGLAHAGEDFLKQLARRRDQRII